MSKIVHIVALDENGVMGVNGALPFNLPEDLKNFKSLTNGSLVIMGFNTYDDIVKNHMNGKDKFLEDRQVIVSCSTSDKAKQRQISNTYENVNFLPSSLISQAISASTDSVLIIGGSKLYGQFSPSVVIATKVHTPVAAGTPGITVYPGFYKLRDKQLYKQLDFSPQKSSNGLDYNVSIYIRN